MLAHHRGVRDNPHRATRNANTHTEQQPGPGPPSNLNHMPTRQVVPGGQSKQHSLTEAAAAAAAIAPSFALCAAERRPTVPSKTLT